MTSDENIATMIMDRGHDSPKVVRSDGRALALASVDLFVYLLSLAALLRTPSLAWEAALAFGPCTIFGLRLLVIGHDAGHGALAKTKWINRLLVRIGFLPALLPASLWQLHHNQKHHRFTNIRPHDISITPISPRDYAQMPSWRKLLERSYRAPGGFAPWYFLGFYIPLFVAPSRARVPRWRARYLLDWCLVALYVGAVIGLGSYVTGAPVVRLVLAVLMPAAAIGMSLSFTGYIQHTHPQIGWFESRASGHLEHQLRVTPHAEFPRWFNRLFHGVFDHTIHHVEPRRPIYALGWGESSLLRSRDEIVRYKFTWKAYMRIVRHCKLYDYDKGMWTTFEGTPS